MNALNNGVEWITSSGRKSDYKLEDTACKCGCGYNPVHQGVIDLLQLIKDCLQVPIKLNCVCRCPEHNEREGGVKNSYHVQGMAADFAVHDNMTGNDMKSELLYDSIRLMEIPCIIRYDGRYFCHIDIRNTDAPVRLSSQKGVYIPIT